MINCIECGVVIDENDVEYCDYCTEPLCSDECIDTHCGDVQQRITDLEDEIRDLESEHVQTIGDRKK